MTTESEIHDALASTFDEYEIRERVRVGKRNTVYDVTVDGRRTACKTTDCQPEILAREGAVLNAVTERTAVPAPSVLSAGDGYLLLEWVHGNPYGSYDARDGCQARLRTVGRTLARLHDATADWFTGHGPLERGAGPLSVDQPTDWSDRFSEFVNRWAADLTAERNADVAAAVVETVGANRDCFVRCSPTLVHGEASPDHVLCDGTEVTALLDWELAQAAPGEFDLVWAERDLLGRPVTDEGHGPYRRALIDGYESERRLEPGFSYRRELYRAAFAMRELEIETDAITAEMDSDEYEASLRTYVRDRLAAAELEGPP